jgi:hypothetical protein
LEVKMIRAIGYIRVTPHQFSVASGRGIDTQATTNKISNLYEKNSQPEFSGSGPDIIALSKNEWWHIECKGSGTGKKQTQRNNFDRALASVVSYFGEDRSNLEEKYKNSRQYLGLALPASPEYINQLIKRVRIPLRKALNLWVLLYEPQTKSIRSIPPSHNIPSKL